MKQLELKTPISEFMLDVILLLAGNAALSDNAPRKIARDLVLELHYSSVSEKEVRECLYQIIDLINYCYECIGETDDVQRA